MPSKKLPPAPPTGVSIQRGTNSVLFHITDENASRWINLDQDVAAKLAKGIQLILDHPEGSRILNLDALVVE